MGNVRDTMTGEEKTITARDRSVYVQRKTDFIVPYSRENINRCRCPLCPVQAESKCVKDKLDNLKKEMDILPADEVPEPDDVPGTYCSTGKATCKDLNPGRQCICNTCDVWKKYALENGTPSQYFCQNGRAT